MSRPTYDTPDVLRALLSLDSPKRVHEFLAMLPIAPADSAIFDPTDPARKWLPGMLHWVPVSMSRGNAGRVRLATQGVNPLAERLVNGMEALIELERQREIHNSPGTTEPSSPREAVARYFQVPPLERLEQRTEQHERARSMAKKIRLKVSRYRGQTKDRFTVRVEDDGIGQAPTRIHQTLLSLSESDKGDKPYLIGLFGQGGSSAFHGTQDHSWLISRRAPDVPGGDDRGAGWSIVKQVFPKNRRDPYYAYLAVNEDGTVPSFSAEVADSVGVTHGSTFGHIDYDFQRSGVSVARNLYPALNHLLFNPVLPYELYNLRAEPDVMWGNSYRLSLKLRRLSKHPELAAEIVDKTFDSQKI